MSRGAAAPVAHDIWDLLVAEAGANERDRWTFVDYLTRDDSLNSWEYRFMGVLGFGGKLHYNTYRGARISCYPEDADEKRLALIDRVNAELAEIAPGSDTT